MFYLLNTCSMYVVKRGSKQNTKLSLYSRSGRIILVMMAVVEDEQK